MASATSKATQPPPPTISPWAPCALGPIVYQLPIHHPIRLAQEAAMVDNLSHGRLEFGAYSIHAHEFMRWELPFAERRPWGKEV